MALWNVACDSRPYVVIGMVLALTLGFDSQHTSTILTVALIALMTLSLDGVTLRPSDFKRYRREMLWGIFSTFVVNMSLALIAGLFFLDDTGLWYGWVMLAIAPSAMATLSSAIYMNGDTRMALLGLTAVYMASLFLTPILSFILIGDAVNPLDIMKYIILFITVPFILSIPLKRLRLKKGHKIIGINSMMFVMVFVGMGSRQDYFFDEFATSMWILVACILRICVLSIIMVFVMRRMGVRRENAVVYNTMMYWKNSTMVASLCMALLGATYPEASLPCVISLIVETLWFSVMTRTMGRIWPEDRRGSDPLVEEC